MMFAGIRLRLKDVGTLRRLLLRAEALARAEGMAEPGSEHLVMAAFDLPDESAKRAFKRVQSDPDLFSYAVTKQYADALGRIGVEAADALISPEALPPVSAHAGVFRSRPSAQSVLRTLARTKAPDPPRPLMGADVVLAAVSSEGGIVARALAVMGINPDHLADACRSEIAACGGRP